jgi:hypothetical protein
MVIGVIQEHPMRGTFKVFILPAANRPEQHQQRRQADQQGTGYDCGHSAHTNSPRVRRKAFRLTNSEELDIVAAARSGVTKPSAASGMASRL